MSFQVSYDDADLGAGFVVEAFSLPQAVAKARDFRAQGRQNIWIRAEGGARMTLAQAEARLGNYSDA